MARPVDTDGAEDMDRTDSLILGGREARAPKHPGERFGVVAETREKQYRKA